MRLKFENVSVSYGKRRILQEVSFDVESGSITALIGRNGAGKSTLVSCLTGEKRDYGGGIMIGEQNVRDLELTERALKIACLPQNLPRPHVTVRELVSFGRTPYTPLTGKLSGEDKEKIAWALESVGMTEFADSFVDTLSGGERKKAFFAMTLAQDTPVAVLDEPTAHLDVVNRFEFMALLDHMRRETGKTFLVVMHELTEVLRCADRIVAIGERKVDFDGTPEECLAAGVPEKCFGIRITGDKDNGYAVRPLR